MHRRLGAPPRFPRLLIVLLFIGAAAYQDAQARRAINTCLDITDQAKGRGNSLLQVSMPVLLHTVTNFDPSWFDLENPQRAPTLFLLTLNLPDSLAGRVRLKMIVSADTSLGRKDDLGARMVALDRMSQPLEATVFNRPLRSNEVFDFDWVPGYGTSFQESDLFDVVTRKRLAPEMNLHFSFALACEDDATLFATTTTVEVSELGGALGRLRYVRNLQALYPGTQVTNPRPVNVYTINPIFKVITELFNRAEYDYPADEPKVEVFLYELLEGERPEDAVNGLEFAKFGMLDESPMAYPAHLPRLEPGRTYVWRARANLRGPTSDYLFSKPLYFKVDERLEGGSGATLPVSELTDPRAIEQQIKFGDDFVKRVLAALKIILGENFEVFDLSRAGKLPAKGQIRLNGHPYTLEELERLARDFHQGKHSLTRLRFQ